MSYRDYVIAAYAVFFVVLAWDFVAPRIGIARELRAAKLRAARKQARTAPDGSNELSRQTAE